MNDLKNNRKYTLTWQTFTEEKSARVRQMWPRTVSGRLKRTSPYVRSWPRRARAQMVCSGASLTVLAGIRSATLGYILAQKNLLLALLVALAAYISSCTIQMHPLGSKNLSEDNMERIVEGVTTKDDVRNLLGVPMQAMILDEVSLADFLTRTFPVRLAGYRFPEDQYEVWTYSKLTQSLILGRNIEERSLIVMSSGGICIAKFYERNGEVIE